MPAIKPNNKYNIPISLWFVVLNHLYKNKYIFFIYTKLRVFTFKNINLKILSDKKPGRPHIHISTYIIQYF